jgi:hypothetical protein
VAEELFDPLFHRPYLERSGDRRRSQARLALVANEADAVYRRVVALLDDVELQLPGAVEDHPAREHAGRDLDARADLDEPLEARDVERRRLELQRPRRGQLVSHRRRP